MSEKKPKRMSPEMCEMVADNFIPYLLDAKASGNHALWDWLKETLREIESGRIFSIANTERLRLLRARIPDLDIDPQSHIPEFTAEFRRNLISNIDAGMTIVITGVPKELEQYVRLGLKKIIGRKFKKIIDLDFTTDADPSQNRNLARQIISPEIKGLPIVTVDNQDNLNYMFITAIRTTKERYWNHRSYRPTGPIILVEQPIDYHPDEIGRVMEYEYQEIIQELNPDEGHI